MGYAARLGARSRQRARAGWERAPRAESLLPNCVDYYYGEGHDDGDDDEGELKDLLEELFALNGG